MICSDNLLLAQKSATLFITMKKMWASNKQQGFTIVELLIVIVVIAILAAIVIVAYSGIQKRAVNAQILTSVHNYENSLQLTLAYAKTYPTLANDTSLSWSGTVQDGVAACIGTNIDTSVQGYCYSFFNGAIWTSAGGAGWGAVKARDVGPLYSNFIQQATGDVMPKVSSNSPITLTSSVRTYKSTGIMYGFNFPGPYNRYIAEAKTGVFLYYALNGRSCADKDIEVSLDQTRIYTKGPPENPSNLGEWPINDSIRCARKVSDTLPVVP